MKKYALILAALTFMTGSTLYGQATGGAAGGGAGAGASGATGGAGAASSGRTGSTVGSAGTTRSGVAVSPNAGSGALPAPAQPVAPGNAIGGVGAPNQGTPALQGQPATGVGTGRGSNSGAIGGTGPGTGGIGGTVPGAATSPLDAGASATTGVQPGAGSTINPQTGLPGVATTPGVNGVGSRPVIAPSADLQRGVTTQPGVGIGETGTGTVADMNMAQRVRGQLLNSGLIAPPNGQQVRTGTGITPQSLSNVQINANGNRVTLQGSVGSEAERRLIETRIRQMTGVQGVVNNLTVNAAGARVGQGTPGAIGTDTGTSTGAGSVPTTSPVPR